MLEGLLYSGDLAESTLDCAALESARNLVVSYAVRLIPSSRFLKLAKKFSRRTRDALFFIKRQYLDRTEYFLTRLWRAYHSIIRDYIKVKVACQRYGVLPEDIYLVMEILSPDDTISISKSKIRIERMDEANYAWIHKAIETHSNILFNRGRGSPRFIATNDPGISPTDIKRYLTEEGHRLFLYYEHFFDPERIENYVKRGMTYACVNFILYNRAQCRQAIADVSSSSREFMLTRVSIEAKVEDNYGDTKNLGEVVRDNRLVQPDVILEQKRMLLALKREPKDVRRFVQIIIGNRFSQSFIKWMIARHGVTPEEAESKSDYYTLGEFAMEYLGVTRKMIEKHVAPHLEV